VIAICSVSNAMAEECFPRASERGSVRSCSGIVTEAGHPADPAVTPQAMTSRFRPRAFSPERHAWEGIPCGAETQHGQRNKENPWNSGSGSSV